jgi:hypothetical protein
MAHQEPLVHGPKFNVATDVKYKDERWHVSGCSGGPLLGFVYLLTCLDDGKQVTVPEEELEPWKGQ